MRWDNEMVDEEYAYDFDAKPVNKFAEFLSGEKK